MAKTSAANQSPSSSQLNTKSIKKEKDPSDLAAVAALAEQERMKKRNEEKEKEKRKSNLELFKEELKRLAKSHFRYSSKINLSFKLKSTLVSGSFCATCQVGQVNNQYRNEFYC
jgi:hypothetical protein